MDEAILFTLLQFIPWVVIISVFVIINRHKKVKAKQCPDPELEKEAVLKAKDERFCSDQDDSHLLVRKYLEKTQTIQAADFFAQDFIRNVKSLKRDPKYPKIQYQSGLSGEIGKLENSVCQGIRISVDEYSSTFQEMRLDRGVYAINFEKQNLRPLTDLAEIKAFTRAISERAYKKILKDYPMDESGAIYTLTCSERLICNRSTYGITVQFHYICNNGYYEHNPPAEW